jgi:hypothetical protein
LLDFETCGAVAARARLLLTSLRVTLLSLPFLMSSGGEAAAPAAKKMRLGAPPEGWLPRRKVNVLGEWADGPAAPLRPAWLVKTALALPAGHPSPAALQGCRVALQVRPASAPSGAKETLTSLPVAAAVSTGC